MSQNLKFEQVVKIVNEFSILGESKGLAKLFTEDEVLYGRHIKLKGKNHVNFGSCSYLGLELDTRLKEAAIEAVKKYGTYFSCSRIYVSCGNYLEVEDLLSQIFNTNILLTTNSTLGHHSVMPIIIGTNDMVIYDQQAHVSMQELSYKLSHYGTGITILRHNRLDELEQKYERYKSKYDKIWYVIDGVYSMFGDLAPIKDIVTLLDKHKKLHLYVDDAHGMSWAGPNGSGYTLSQTPLHPKMILGTSMAKGFGSCGGIFLFPNKADRDKVKGWGGPLAYSGPQEPATVAAAIASAKIHLSNEIYELQDSLQEKINYCNHLMAQYRIPLVSESCSGIFFVACGLPRVGFNLVERLMGEGFYTNIGIFPAVPETCTGVRFTMTNHITFEDIEKLVKAFAYHHPRALKEEGRSMHDIYKAFRKFTDFETRLGPADNFMPPISENEAVPLHLKIFNTIKEIDKTLWNNILGDNGGFDHDTLALFEDAFTSNNEIENNWKFYYYLVYDDTTPIAVTFFTSLLNKDDALVPAQISRKIEEVRKENPYYLTSKTIMMGSMLTNGSHLYLDKTHKNWQDALTLILDDVGQLKEKEKANTLYLRDFEPSDKEINQFFTDQGFIKIDLPENNILADLKGLTFNQFLSKRLSAKKRTQLKSETLPNIEEFTFKILQNITDDDVKVFYNLYKNVKSSTYALNTFDLPYSLFEKISRAPNWEIAALVHNDSQKIACISLCIKTTNNYCDVIYGADKSFDKYSVYKKMFYFIVQRGIELEVENIYLGITTNDTKRKFGAEQIQQVAYIQVKDKYNQELIDSMSFGSIPNG